jgi:hypothetical protein
VTSFLSERVPVLADGADNARQGRVAVISTATDTVVGTVSVLPLADSGFKANGDALARIAPGASFTFTTGAYPNQLANVAIHDHFAYLPSTGASPNGPVRFDVNTQSWCRPSTPPPTPTPASRSISTPRSPRRAARRSSFPTQPWAIAFEHADDAGYVASAGERRAAQGAGRQRRPASRRRPSIPPIRRAFSRSPPARIPAAWW